MKDGPEQWSGLKQDDLAIHARSRSVELAHRFYGRVSMCEDRMMLKKKKKEGRMKNKVSLSPFLFFLPSMLGYLSPRSRYPLLVPGQRVEITHL